jgi:sulfur carrier protein
MSRIELNGRPHDIGTGTGTTIADLVAALARDASGCAVAVNGVVVPRSDWQRTVAAGDHVEVLTAVQGG